MILKLEISNFYSIKEKQTLDFRIPLTAPNSDRFGTANGHDDIRLPKIVAFFGANASGKTTFLRAITFLQAFMERSFHVYEPNDPIAIKPFQRSECEVGITTLALEFSSLQMVDLLGRIYRYELHIQHHSGGNFVLWESLSELNDRRKFSAIFERRGTSEGSEITASDAFLLPEDDPKRTVRSNVSLLSSLVQFAHAPSRRVVDDFRLNTVSNISLGKTSFSEDFVAGYLKNNPDFLTELNRLIRVIDVGIEKVEITEEDKRTVPLFHHSGLDGYQTIQYESQGTRNFFCLFPNLIYSLRVGATAILDEMDSDLHPALMWEIVRWYHSKTENPHRAQLFVSCQNPSILSELEKEEVCLVEKSDRGESSAKRLSDFGHIRRDTNLYKKYLSGAFGAVPKFG